MFENKATQARIASFAWVMAWFGLVIGQLHALARFATDAGQEDLESGIVRGWAEPAAEFLKPMLDWASPDAVYVHYGKLWLPVFAGFTLAAFVVHAHRRGVGFHGAEKWAWRVVLTAYAVATVGVGVQYWTQWGSGNMALADAVFITLAPALVVTMVASSVLGIVLIRRGLGLPAWLLSLTAPGLIVISTVTSLGNVVLRICFAMALLANRVEGQPKSSTEGLSAHSVGARPPA